MSPLQLLTIVATTLGIVATVLNLVAFVREKDRGHLKAGLAVLALLAAILAVALVPTVAPGPTAALLKRLPPEVASRLDSWLPKVPPEPEPAPAPAAAEPAPPALQGSATVEIRRNLLGGIDSIVAVFQFADLSGRGGRVTSYRFGVQEQEGGPVYAFERVLPEPVEVPAGAGARTEVELDPEIGDRWLARRDQERPGRLEVEWQGVDASGQGTRFDWVDRVAR